MSSETFSLDDIDYIPLLTQEVREGKFKSVDPRFLDAYRRCEMREEGYNSYPKIAASMGLAGPGGIDTQFRIIKGRISELRGKLFELAILRQYLLSNMVTSMTPPATLESLQYPNDCAAEKQPDRIITLLNGEIRICSWKCYAWGGGSTIHLGVKKKGGFLHCPEIRRGRELIERGGNPDYIRVVVEGVMGRRERNTVVPEYFRMEVDPFTCDHSITIPKAGRMAWPPSVFELTKIRPKIL